MNCVSFGEILWDIFPSQQRIGGAPLNVASRLRFLGNAVSIISRVGKDKRGIGLQDYLSQQDINTQALQYDKQYPTGMVKVSLDDNTAPCYDIVLPAAWDFIALEAKAIDRVKKADAFIYGSLAARSPVSQKTLYGLLEKANFKICDLNLRPPHFHFKTIQYLIQQADFIKGNEEELRMILAHFDFKYSDDINENIDFLSQVTSTANICVTLGEKGSVLLWQGKKYYHSGYKVIVKNTVGAGDSFLATLLDALFQDQPPGMALKRANAVGAIVAGDNGANPHISSEQISTLINQFE